MAEAPAPEPVAEPMAVSTIEPFGEGLQEVADFAAPPPPRDVGVMPEGTPGLVLPRLISKCSEPLYPVLAARIGLQGVVVLRALITEQGEVASIELFQAPRPDLGFSDSAIAALSCWVYEPGRYQGRAVAVSLTVIVDFEIN
jgi:TonB family protein